LAGSDARVDARASLHPAQVGRLARLALWPRVHGLLSKRVRTAGRRGDAALGRFLSRHPNLSAMLVKVGDRVRPRRWPLPQLWPVTHHQKAAVIDGRLTYLGGLDLNDRRWDTKAHMRAAEETRHDVQLLVRDRATAGAVETHLGEFTDLIRGQGTPSDLGGRALRTVSARVLGRPRLLAPRPVATEIESALHAAIAGAERSIYVETQFLRDRRIASALAAAARRNPQLHLIVILPAAPEDVAFLGATRSDARFGEFLQAACIRKLRRAYRGRLFVGSPARPRTASGAGRDTLHGAPIIYVHAKVCVVDDAFALVGSANLNGRSLRWDTELAIPLYEPALVGEVRTRCGTHLLGPAADGIELADVRAWQRIADANVKVAPEARTGFIVPHMTGPARRFGRDLPAVPDEMV
jgi:phospholipase D1/2